jgi:preprotein translocase subunit YajC
MDILLSAIATSSNIALVALAVMVLILYNLLKDKERQIQEDRKEMIATLVALTEVITQLRIQLAGGVKK